MFKIIFTESYDKKATTFIKQHPELLGQYEKCLRLLESNPQHPSLRLHSLKGRLKNLHSISINLAYRIIIELEIKDELIIPINIGKHNDIYK